MCVIDLSRVVFVDFNFLEMFFFKYFVESEEVIVFDLKCFLKVFKFVRSRDMFVFCKGGENFFEVGLFGDENMWFKFFLIDVNIFEIEILSLLWIVKVVVFVGVLKRVVKVVKFVFDLIYFMVIFEKLIFKVEGNDFEVRIVFIMEDLGFFDLEYKMIKVKSVYGVVYFEDILRSFVDVDEVIIWFGFDILLFLKYMVWDVGEVSFLIVLRVEEGCL